MAGNDEEVQLQGWSHKRNTPVAGTAAAVRGFAALHGMDDEVQRLLEVAVAGALAEAATTVEEQTATPARVDAALDDEWMSVRIEHAGRVASLANLAPSRTLVRRVESVGLAGRSRVILLECPMASPQAY